MKKEYEEKINELLHVYHLGNQHEVSSGGYSIAMLRHSLHHLCGMAMCSNDADANTIAEIVLFVEQVSKGEVPQYYACSWIGQYPSADGNKTLCIKSPLAVSIELTPEVIKSLRNAIGGQNT